MFRVEQRLYALPLNAVAEIARTVEENIHQVEHYEVLQLRNDVLPLLRLGERRRGPETARRKVFVLVITAATASSVWWSTPTGGRRRTGHQGARRPVDYDRPGERGFDSGRWEGGSHPEHDCADGSLHARTGGRQWPADGGTAVGCHRQVRAGGMRCEDASARRGRGPGVRKPVRVLVVDDSALMRKLIPKILEQDDSIEVVGTAMDGHFALKKIEDLAPQVVTLDLEMPGLNGIDTLKEIMRRWRLPVIVVSSHSTAGASITLKALALGAFDFVAKPQDVSARMPEIAGELIGKIHAAAQSAGVQPQFLPRETHGSMPRQAAAGGADAHRRHRRFHGRSERLAIPVFASAGGIFGQHPGGAAYAGRLHRAVCQAAGRVLPDPGEGSAIGRFAGGRAGADLLRATGT
jgi:DNA-binding NarL/FixJ family response regulator